MVTVRQFLAATVVLGGCSRTETVADTAVYVPPVAEAPAPVRPVIPTWPADTTAFAIDRPLAITPEQRARVPRCAAATPTITTDSVGPIALRQTLPALLEACPARYLAWHWDSGRYGPAIAVRLGTALVIADLNGTTESATVTRVVVFDNARTAQGIRPGSLLAEVSRAYGAPDWRREQCNVDATFASAPGLVIRIALPEEGSNAWSCDAIRRLGSGPDFSRFPRGSRVSWIAVESGGF